MAFVDGEPIDASKLGALETALNELKASIPQIGGSSTTITVNPTTGLQSSTVVAPQIQSKNDGTKLTLVPGTKNKVTIPFTSNFSKTPAVVVSIRIPESYVQKFIDKGISLPTVAVVTSSITERSFDIVVPVSKSAPSGTYVYVSYIATSS